MGWESQAGDPRTGNYTRIRPWDWETTNWDTKDQFCMKSKVPIQSKTYIKGLRIRLEDKAETQAHENEVYKNLSKQEQTLC